MVVQKFENIGQYCDYLCHELATYLKENEIENVVIGISGGIDSAVCLAILSKILTDDNIYAYNIIIDRSTSRKEIEALSEKYAISIEPVDLTGVYDAYNNLSCLETATPRIFANIKSRIRMNYLYAIAAKNKAIVIGSMNATEYYLGYFTKFGDSATDFNLLSGLAKGDVYELAKYLDIPQSIIDREPSADLLPNQTDEKDLGITYEVLNSIANGDDVEVTEKEIALKWHNTTEHKRRSIKLEFYKDYAFNK